MHLIVSEYDKCAYRQLVLENELKVFLIHDAEADKAGAALSVNYGSWNDPSDVQGLAHFVEHLIMMGTKTYPEESDWSTFLAANSGQRNGFTGDQYTMYLFEVGAEHLEPALDRFSRFFTEPLFSESAVRREVEAVDSEHSKNTFNDAWRTTQLFADLSSEDHPSHSFGTGNLETLGKHADLRDRAVDFWRKNYSSNQMGLVILGKESLDDLEALARAKFAGIENKKVSPPEIKGQVIAEKNLKTRVCSVPVAEGVHRVTVAWVLPAEWHLYRQKPMYYLSHLIGHEGEGSILSYLKNKGWVMALLASPDDSANDHCRFSITVEVSDEGLLHANDIVDSFFAYIKLILDHGISETLYNELKVLNELSFRFKDKQDPFSTVMADALAIHRYPPDYMLYGSRVTDIFDAAAIRADLERLIPENLVLHLISNLFKSPAATEFAPNQISKYYGTEYRTDPIQADYIAQWRKTLDSSIDELHARFPGLETPKPNPFIPDDLSLLLPPKDKDEKSPPAIVLDTPTIRVWHKQDQTFKRPRASLTLDFNSSNSYTTPLTVVKSKLFLDYVMDEINEFGYDSQLAGLKYSMTPTINGFTLAISGYNCKQRVLLERLLQVFKTVKIEKERFELVVESALRTYQQMAYSAPYSQAMYQLSLYMEYPRWNYLQYVAQLPYITHEDIQAWGPVLFESLYIEMLAHGNISSEEATTLGNLVNDAFQATPFVDGQNPAYRLVNLEPGMQYWVQHTVANEDETNCAILNYYQIGVQDKRQHVLVELLDTILEPKTFHELRTVQQLGYITASFAKTSNCVDGWSVLVQGTSETPAVLDAKIEEYLKSIPAFLRALTADEFENFRQSVIKAKLEKFTSIGKESASHWEAIAAPHSYNFARRFEEAELLASVTVEVIIAFFECFISAESSQRRKMSIQVWTPKQEKTVPASATPAPVLLSNPFHFKNRMPLHAVLAPGKERVTLEEHLEQHVQGDHEERPQDQANN